MKLSDQVCTLQQAKRLKELGLIQDAEWFWAFPVKPTVISSSLDVYHKTVARDILSDNEGDDFDHALAAAYSVAELGVILPNCFDTMRVISDEGGNEWKGFGDAGDPFPEDVGYKTEAEARATMLIHLLEAGSLTAEEANKRLQA